MSQGGAWSLWKQHSDAAAVDTAMGTIQIGGLRPATSNQVRVAMVQDGAIGPFSPVLTADTLPEGMHGLHKE